MRPRINWLIAVICLAGVAACTNSPPAPATSPSAGHRTASAPADTAPRTATPQATDPTSTRPARTGTTSSTPAHPSRSSVLSHEPTTPVTTNARPATEITAIPSGLIRITIPASIQGDNRKRAETAIAAYQAAIGVESGSLRYPNNRSAAEWARLLQDHLIGPELAKAYSNLTAFQEEELHQVGLTPTTGTVQSVSEGNVQLKLCVDISQMEIIDAAGQAVTNRMRDTPDRVQRKAYLEAWPNGWLVARIVTSDPVIAC